MPLKSSSIVAYALSAIQVGPALVYMKTENVALCKSFPKEGGHPHPVLKPSPKGTGSVVNRAEFRYPMGKRSKPRLLPIQTWSCVRRKTPCVRSLLSVQYGQQSAILVGG